jgi:hypothetical protein
MTPIQDLLDAAVGSGAIRGAAALVARGAEIEIASAGAIGPDSIVPTGCPSSPRRRSYGRLGRDAAAATVNRVAPG